MGKFEDNLIYTSWWFHFIKFWDRYIGDIFLIWTGTAESLKDFVKYLNSIHPTIKFNPGLYGGGRGRGANLHLGSFLQQFENDCH